MAEPKTFSILLTTLRLQIIQRAMGRPKINQDSFVLDVFLGPRELPCRKKKTNGGDILMAPDNETSSYV